MFQSKNLKNKNKVEELQKYDSCLVLDDFGAEKTTDFVRQISYLIVDYREKYELQTIITSNYFLKDIAILLDDRLSSRITGMCKIIKLEGDKRINISEKELIKLSLV